MHPQIQIEELKMATEEFGHRVTNIWNIKKKFTKKPLPIFFVDSGPNSNNKSTLSNNTYIVKFLSKLPDLREISHNALTVKGTVKRYGQKVRSPKNILSAIQIYKMR